MTDFNIKEYLGGLTSHIMFEYNGYSCGVDPLSLDKFDMWYGDKSMTAHSIEEVMETKFFDLSSPARRRFLRKSAEQIQTSEQSRL